MILYPPNTLFPIRLGDVTFHVKQLTAGQKAELRQFYISRKDGSEAVVAGSLVSAVLKHALRKVDGCFWPDGSKFELKFDANGDVEDESLNCIEQIDGHLQVVQAAQHLFLQGVSDPKVEGVTIDFEAAGGGQKKSSAQALVAP